MKDVSKGVRYSRRKRIYIIKVLKKYKDIFKQKINIQTTLINQDKEMLFVREKISYQDKIGMIRKMKNLYVEV